MFFYVYVIQSLRDEQWYTGYTNDLKRRLSEHNQQKNFSTKLRAPFKLIYYEACRNSLDAKRREKFLKTGMGKRYLRNRIKSDLDSYFT
jgi:putative endonuclease